MNNDPVTTEMIEAAENVEDLYKRGTPDTWVKVYRAMRSASPVHTNSQLNKKLIGWVILDKHDVVHNFYSKTKHFYGSIEEDTAPTQEYLNLVDRDWAGLAPHTVKEIYHDTN